MKQSGSIWPPFTQTGLAPEPLKVVRGQGVWLEFEDGRRVIDAISSWWVNLHGHSRPEIAEAIYDQARQLEHVIFAGYTHDPAQILAQILVDALPDPLSKVFFSDNGSTAVEVAMKMAIQASYNIGQAKARVVAFEGAYHGDTFGAMAAGERSVFSAPFDGMLFEVDRMPYPATWEGDAGYEAREWDALLRLEEHLRVHRDEVAMVMIEPFVQGAGGMRMVEASFLQGIANLCKKYDILLCFDEVMTGFGRTGELFACIKAGVSPDIICLSKGITGGFLPLSVTVTSQSVFDAFHSNDPLKALYHGHSYTANPLGCAAAIASWKILSKEQAYRNLESRYQAHLERLRAHPSVEKIRSCGTILAFDVISHDGGYFASLGPLLKQRFAQTQALIRPLGNTIYIMPPYVISEDELSLIFDEILLVLRSLKE
jgi:adenosylmethionine---8-amino-7-oxononanoate aminotransferase